MLTHALTQAEAQEMRTVWEQYHTALTPNRRTGAALIGWLCAHYPVTECGEAEALDCLRENILQNDFYREKLPPGAQPRPRAFWVENTGKGAALYTPEVTEGFGITRILVMIDEVTGEFQVEHSPALWDALFCFRGLDEQDITNPFLVWQYVILISNQAIEIA